MGRPKPLLPFNERTAVEVLIASLQDAGIEDIVLVLGPQGEAVAQILEGGPVTLAWNCVDGSDMADSLRLGLTHLAAESTGVLVALVDHPLVTAETVASLCAQHQKSPEAILIPTFGDRKGHPILLPRSILVELSQLSTLREVVRRDPARILLLPVTDQGILFDLDTPADYLEALKFIADRR